MLYSRSGLDEETQVSYTASGPPTDSQAPEAAEPFHDDEESAEATTPGEGRALRGVPMRYRYTRVRVARVWRHHKVSLETPFGSV